jgi:hypothetical protein
MSDQDKKKAVEADELSRIDAMIAQHSEVFDGAPQLRYSRAVKYGEDQKKSSASGGPSVPHGNYRCHKCGETGHFIQDCPVGTEEGKMGKVRQARGIPKTFLESVTEAEAAKSGGGFVSAEGDLVVMKTASKEERLRLVGASTDVELQRSFGRSWEQVKKCISCFLCSEVAKNPVVTPCCGELFCRQCVLSHLDRTIISLDESIDARECPNCDRKGLVASELVPVKALSSLLGAKQSANSVSFAGRKDTDVSAVNRKKRRVDNKNSIEIELRDAVREPDEQEGLSSEEEKGRYARHPHTVLVPGGPKNPFFDNNAPLLTEAEFALWQRKFRQALHAL